jgi:hypothetical protein
MRVVCGGGERDDEEEGLRTGSVDGDEGKLTSDSLNCCLQPPKLVLEHLWLRIVPYESSKYTR